MTSEELDQMIEQNRKPMSNEELNRILDSLRKQDKLDDRWYEAY